MGVAGSSPVGPYTKSADRPRTGVETQPSLVYLHSSPIVLRHVMLFQGSFHSRKRVVHIVCEFQ